MISFVVEKHEPVWFQEKSLRRFIAGENSIWCPSFDQVVSCKTEFDQFKTRNLGAISLIRRWFSLWIPGHTISTITLRKKCRLKVSWYYHWFHLFDTNPSFHIHFFPFHRRLQVHWNIKLQFRSFVLFSQQILVRFRAKVDKHECSIRYYTKMYQFHYERVTFTNRCALFRSCE